MLPQAPWLAASNRSKSISGSTNFPAQFHFPWERQALIKNARLALDVPARIETMALGERPAHVDTGCPSEMDNRATSAPKDVRLRVRALNSSHHEMCNFWVLTSFFFSGDALLELQDV
jgi:hypothetical protein